MHATNYRPDIDGLRAVAILSVVFFHAGLGCPGGYVGVDVFFVISGYVITTMILKGLRDETFSLSSFWERRIRRIFPAMIAANLATVFIGWFLLLPEHLKKLGQATIAQALLSANIYFWRTTNYFGGGNEEKPLLHTWSLAVEEQFYLFFPLLLVVLFRRAEIRRPLWLISIILIGTAGSFCIAIWGVKHQPIATFFMLPTRAWELLCGATIAMLPTTWIPASRLVREGAAWVGALGIFLPVFLYGEATPFPGLAALPPCSGTALLIWANSNSTTRTLPAILLSLRGVVFIGLISYSLYLWHWPIIAFGNYWRTAPYSLSVRWTFIGLSFAMALLSWRYVETPFRNRAICATRHGIFQLFGGATLLAISLGSLLVVADGFPARVPKSTMIIIQSVEENAAVWRYYSTVNRNIDDLSEIEHDSLKRFGSNVTNAPLRFLVLGDSHAGCTIPIFEQLGRKYGVTGAAITHQGTPPVFGCTGKFWFSAKEPDQLWQAALGYAQRNKIRYIFLVAYWYTYQHVIGTEELEQSLKMTLARLHSEGFKVYVVIDNPTYEGDVVKALVRKSVIPYLPSPIYACSEEDQKKKNRALYDLGSNTSDTIFLDPSPFLLDPATRTYIVTWHGMPLYRDKDHLTFRGEEIALRPVLEPVFRNELRLGSD